jgi:hypothetical protein
MRGGELLTTGGFLVRRTVISGRRLRLGPPVVHDATQPTGLRATFGCVSEIEIGLSREEGDDDDEGTVFELALSLAGARCPNCDYLGESGQCPKCGTEVPEPDEAHYPGEVVARRKALLPLRDRVGELEAAFDDIATETVAVSADQFLTAVTDVELFRQLDEVGGLGHTLAALDLNDAKVIGGELRALLNDRIGRVERLLNSCRELAIFEPEGPGKELQRRAIELGAWSAKMLGAFIHAVCAPTLTQAKAASAALQELLTEEAIAIDDSLWDRLREWGVYDVDSRVAIALDRPGFYTDEFGLLDPSLVFSAYQDRDDPLTALGEQARRYFSHLLPGETRSGVEPFLVLPMVSMATLDRPLVAHRIARLLVDLLEDVQRRDPTALLELLNRTTAAGPLIFAAVARIGRALRLLVNATQAGLIDDQDILAQLMTTYEQLSESVYRTLGWLILDLSAISTSGSFDRARSQAPTLGPLSQQLRSLNSQLGEELADAIDSNLRNATSHAQYRWDAVAEKVIDLREGHEWTREEFEARIDALVSAVGGADAGYACFIAGMDQQLPVPDWLKRGEVPEALQLIATATFGAYGFKVVSVRDAGATIVIEHTDELELVRLMAPLGGQAALVSQAEAIRVIDDLDGSVVLEASAQSLQEAGGTEESVRDLALFGPFYEAALATGMEPALALRRMVAIQVAVIALNALQEFDQGGLTPEWFARLNRRVAFVHSFVRKRADRSDREMRALVDRLERARKTTFLARNGNGRAIGQLPGLLQSLIAWVDKQGISWPPI